VYCGRSDEHLGSVDEALTEAASVKTILKMLLSFVIAAGFSPLHATQHSSSQSNADFVSVVRLSLDIMERHYKGNIVVVPQQADARLVDALSALHRRVIDKGSIPYSSSDALPDGYIQLTSVRVYADHAEFNATLGPVGRAVGHREAWTCGTAFSISLNKAHGVWTVGQVKSTLC
jgi:hypothetical protein